MSELLWIVMATRAGGLGIDEEHRVLSVWADYVKAQGKALELQEMLDDAVPGIGITIHVSGPWPLEGMA